jgi:zinc transport system ATP-binding protein
MALIELKNARVSYDQKIVLDKVNFSVASGEIVTIVGPNGSGKSTLLKVMTGVKELDAGSLSTAPKVRLGYVPQKIAIDDAFPMTVRRFLKIPFSPNRKVMEEALVTVGFPNSLDRQIGELSGGQLQRVMLARAIIGSPDVLMLDEPTQGLDQSGAADFYQMIETLREEMGCAVVMVSHDLHVVMSASDRVICLNGHICCEGTPAVVSTAPEYRALFGRGTKGALALYQHDHDHTHEHGHEHSELCDHE